MKLFAILVAAIAAMMKNGGHTAPLEHLFLFGLVINQPTLDSTFKSFKTIFQNAFDGAKAIATQLAVEVPSNTRQEEYKWLGQFPGLREWIGERVIKDLTVEGFVIKNRDFEATVSVDRNDMEDDTISIYNPLFQQLGESAKQHPDELLFDLVVNGFANTCYDGKPFFAADHPNGAQADWSNIGSAALDQTAYEAARAAMMSLVNEEGRPLRIKPTLMIVPPQLEPTALSILTAARTANGESNIWRNSADLHVAPELAGHPTYWFLADVGRAAKPFIFQKRKQPQFHAKDTPQDERAFMEKEFIYGVDYRGNAGYGLPQLMFGSTGGA